MADQRELNRQQVLAALTPAWAPLDLPGWNTTILVITTRELLKEGRIEREGDPARLDYVYRRPARKQRRAAGKGAAP